MKKKLLITFLSIIVVIAAGFSLSACNKVEEILFDKPENISYDGSYITWDRVEFADYYTVAINNGEAVRSNSTTYSYTSSDTFDVTITAIFDGAETSASVTFKPLSKIENIYISENGALSWDVISGANAYLLSINGQTVTTTDTIYEQLPEGGNRVRIKPIVFGDNSYYSKFSDEVNVYIYSAPSNIKYDEGVISWTGNASSYNVRINGVDSTVTGNSLNYDSENKDFTVSIRALGNHTSTYDSKTIEEAFYYLDPITNLIVEDGVVRWDEIEGATGYRVKINDIVRTTTTVNEFDQLSTGVSQDVSILPVNENGNYFSSWSAEKSIYILSTPSVSWNNDLNLDGEANNNFIWDGVSAASGYTVRLIFEGNLVDTFTYSDFQRYFAYAYEQVGIYTVEVKANAPSGSADYYDSRYSTPITIERLSAPKAATSNFIVSDRDNLNSGFVVNYTQVSGAAGYQLYKDGVIQEGKYSTGLAITDNNVSDPTIITQQEYTYMIRSMGGLRTIGGQTYVTLPCLSSSALSFNITVQAAPQNLGMSGTTLSWSAVLGNNGYTVSFAGNTNTAQTESYDLSTLSAGTYSIGVSTRGNGSNILASNFSSPINVQRLQAPTNISIIAEGNGTLKYDSVTYAEDYSVYIDLSQTALDTNSYDNMYDFISTEGTTVSMVAEANYYNSDQTIYYMSSEISPTYQFIRLAAPTFSEGAFANSVELVWNAPENINTQEYTPTYTIYSAIDEAIGGSQQNSTRFNIENLEGGRSHTFYVKAIGNDTKYLDSEYSVAISIYKLATPTIIIQNNQYTWDGVANAGSYIITIDGSVASDEYHTSGNSYSFTPRYTTGGDHTVTLQAIGDGRTTINSNVYTYIQKTAILDTPVIDFEYSSDSYVTNGSISVTIDEAINNCIKYQYEIAGETITSSELSYSKTIYNTGVYTIRLKALGGVIDSEGVYYLDSMYAQCEKGSSITLLGAPSATSFNINSDGVITWGLVTSSFGYDYQISYNGEEFESIEHTPYTSLDPIVGYRQYESITIRVMACGNSTQTVISSQWVEWTWTNSNFNG